LVPSWCLPFALPPALIAAASTSWHAVAAGSFSWRLLCWSFLAGVAFATIGTAFLSALAPRTRLATESISSLNAWLAGFILTSSALLLLCFISPFGIDINCALLVLAAFSSLAFRAVRAGWTHLSLGRLEILVLLLVVVCAGFWSQENIAAIAMGANTVVVRPWVDEFFHATYVSLFAHANGAAHLSNPWVSGQPVGVYHYGGYMAASLLCRLTGLDAYSLTVGWYAPMGLLLTGLAARMLGGSLLGPWGGLGAVCFALLIPDPSYYGLGNRWTSYFFFQTVGVGGAYAVAVLGMAWALFFTYLRTSGPRFFFAALLFGGLSLFFKAQIFLVYSFGLLVFTALFVPGVRWPTRALLLTGFLLALVFAAALLPRVPNAPTLEIDPSRLGVNLGSIFNNFSPAVRAWLHEHWQNVANSTARFWSGAAIVLVTTYGAWLLAMILALGISVKSRLPWAWNAFPLIMLANHLFVALCLAPNRGNFDPYEVIHKTFVLPYFAVTAWSGAMLFVKIAGSPSGTRLRRLMLAAISVAALSTVYEAGQTVQSGLSWSGYLSRLGFQRGLYDAARFVREHTPTGSVVQYSENDGFSMFLALGERKSYVVHAHALVSAGPPTSEEVSRMREVGKLLELPTAEAVKAAAAALGIDWLLLSPKRQPLWAAQLKPDFESQGFRLFHVGHGASFRTPAVISGDTFASLAGVARVFHCQVTT
jgi:hypothetical protein